MATFCKGLSVCHLVRPFEQGCKTAFGLPKSFQEFESGAVPESAWRQPLHDPLPSCTTLFLAEIEPATYGS